MKLPSVSFQQISPKLLPPDPKALPRSARRLTELLIKGSVTPHLEALRTWSLESFLSPKSFNPSAIAPDSVGSMTFVKNQIRETNPFDPSARVSATEGQVSLPTSLAFRSIGYRAEAIPGMHDVGIDFDAQKGIIPNDGKGRIIAESDEGMTTVPGLYCSGWVKQGPTGVIANTMEDAFATAEAIAEDWECKAPFLKGGDGWATLKSEVTSTKVRTVDWGDWQKIDAAERKEGARRRKEREKLTSVEKMLEVLD